MKRLLILLTVVAFACVDNQVQQPITTGTDLDFHQQGGVNPNARTATDPGVLLSTNYFDDWSNTVHTVIVEKSFGAGAAQYNVGVVTVPSGYVLIGGGAHTTDTNTASAGAYLTDSSPFFAGEWWEASSKDHIYPDPHTLVVYAVGLKIDGVSETTLRNNLQRVESNWSSPAQPTPNISVSLSAGYNLVSGGAWIDYANCGGNLMTMSTTFGNGWIARGKDHVVQCYGVAKAFAVGIPSTIPGFSGQIETSIQTPSPSSGYGVQTTSSAIPSTYAPAGIGAYAGYSNGKGRLLTSMRLPTSTNSYLFSATSKDLKIADTGVVHLDVCLIRKKPGT